MATNLTIAVVPPKPTPTPPPTYDLLGLTQHEVQTIERALQRDNPQDAKEMNVNFELWDKLHEFMESRDIPTLRGESLD